MHLIFVVNLNRGSTTNLIVFVSFCSFFMQSSLNEMYYYHYYYLLIKLSFTCQPEKFPWSGLQLVTRAIHQG